MTITELMKEYNLEIDDIRWYLSIIEAEKLLNFPQDRKELIRYIWSGELADNLYNMEEAYLNSLQEQMDRNITDESNIRDFFKEAELASLKRKR
jgi:predicted transcriptional regulator